MVPVWVAVTILSGHTSCVGRSLSGVYRHPAVELLGHKGHVVSTQVENAQLFSKATAPIYSPVWMRFPVAARPCQQLSLTDTFIRLTRIMWTIVVDWACISLLTDEDGYPSIGFWLFP